MLELKNVNKYFNRRKKNEIHVIDSTSLTISDTGLVALLGPSGCGKTTLLNTIGGLDKINKGSIYIDNQKISSKLSHKVDRIRNLNVGYIFQDYKLIDNLSVYDNIALVLKMIGIKDKKEIKLRTEYVLDKVGMLRYKYRPASMLSGGERQRVAIARAIVKDPNIILADEPTGNLDSKNSLEIMNIIKAISKNKLVILVTHEQNLAKFYADRIIEISDGKIEADYQNEHNDELDYEIDNTFYLKDFDNQVNLKDNIYDIDIYSDNLDKVKLDIVVKNGNIYIKSNTKDKVQVIDDQSSIEFINSHYKKIDKKDIDKYEFNFSSIINKDIKKKYSSILNPLTLLINGFKKVFDYPFLKKILLVGFALAGMFIMYSTSSISASLVIKDSRFVTINKNYLSVTQKKLKVNDFLSYENLDSVNYILPGNSIVTFSMKYKDYYQTTNQTDNLKASLSSIDMIKDSDLIYGRMPENDYELVVDKMSIEKMFSEEISKMSGLLTVKDMLNRNVFISNMNDFIIVGITDKESPSIYINNSMFINILASTSSSDSNMYYIDDSTTNTGLVDYKLYENKIELKSGRMPENDYEVIVNITNKDNMPLNKQIDYKVNDTKLTVVGYYYSKYSYDYYLVNNNTIKYNLISTSSDMVVYSNNKEITLEELRNNNLNISDSYTKSKNDYIESQRSTIKNTIIVSGIMLLISLIEIFLMIRSSFLSRVKEIGTYRAIGVKKNDIYKMFTGEIFAITTLSGLPGLLLMSYILKVLSGISYLSTMFVINIPLVLLAITFLYLFNLIIGLFPVFNTIRKTPSSILSRYDVD